MHLGPSCGLAMWCVDGGGAILGLADASRSPLGLGLGGPWLRLPPRCGGRDAQPRLQAFRSLMRYWFTLWLFVLPSSLSGHPQQGQDVLQGDHVCEGGLPKSVHLPVDKFPRSSSPGLRVVRTIAHLQVLQCLLIWVQCLPACKQRLDGFESKYEFLR